MKYVKDGLEVGCPECTSKELWDSELSWKSEVNGKLSLTFSYLSNAKIFLLNGIPQLLEGQIFTSDELMLNLEGRKAVVNKKYLRSKATVTCKCLLVSKFNSAKFKKLHFSGGARLGQTCT